MLQALERFLNSDAWPKAIGQATKAGFGGSGYSVELYDDGRFRVLWDDQIGTLYHSDGIILGIPQLDSEEIEEWEELGDDTLEFYAQEWEEHMRDKLEAQMERG